MTTTGARVDKILFLLRSWVTVSGSTALLLGISVQAGWYLHNINLIQVNASFVPMQYNTALGFSLSGAAILGLAFSWQRFSLLTGVPVLLLGTLTLIEYIIGVDLRIDELFIDHYIQTQVSHPGRMAPNTALCFSLTGIAILLAGMFDTRKFRVSAWIACLGALIIGLGFVAFTGYIIELETAYGWGHLTRMSVHTATGFVVLGSGLVALAWCETRKIYPEKPWPQWIPLLLGIIGMTITVTFWQALVAYEQTMVARHGPQAASYAEEGWLLFGTLLTLTLVLTTWIKPDRGRTERFLSRNYEIYIVIGLGAILSVSVYSLLERSFAATEKARFESAVSNHVKALEYGAGSYFESLYDIRSGFNASSFVDRDEFRALTERQLLNFPGIKAIEWIPLTRDSERTSLETDTQNRVDPEFHISDLDGQGNRIIAPRRERYFPVFYVEPQPPNLTVLGFDAGGNPELLKALMRAVDNDRPVVLPNTDRNPFAAKGHDRVGILPIYQRNQPVDSSAQRHAALKGFVAAVIEFGPMIDAILQRHTNPAGIDLAITDSDPDRHEKQSLLYKHISRSRHDSKDADLQESTPLHREVRRFRFADQFFGVTVTPTNLRTYPGWNPNNLWLPAGIFLLSIGLAFYLKRMAQREQERAQLLAYQTALLDAIPNPIFVKDVNSAFTACNKAYEQAFGIRREDIISKTLLDVDFLPESKREILHWEDMQLINRNGLTQEEAEFPYNDGNIHHVMYWRTTFSLNSGRPGGMIGLMMDITQRKLTEIELAKSQKMIRAVLDHSPAVVYLKDLDGHYMMVNRIWSEVTGVSEKRAIGATDYDFLPADVAENFVINDRRVVSGKRPVQSEEHLKHPDGKVHTYISYKFPVTDRTGRMFAVGGVSTEISDLKNLQDDLEAARDNAQKANSAKSEFLANMSHEIRTPMNAIIGLTHLALRTGLTTRQKDYLNKIYNAAQSLLGIINDILDFSKIEAGKLDMEIIEFDLNEVLDNLSNLLQVKSAEKNLEFLIALEPDVPVGLVGDPLRLNQILVNLGNNAIKFTEHGSITLSIASEDRDEDRVNLRFSVKDTGIGLTQEQQQRLFKAFSQADGSTTRKYGGTGLGLTISKHLTEMMGGQIGVESETDQGTIFWFTAQFGIASSLPDKRELIAVQDLQGLRVLMVDDNPTSRQILGGQITGFGFRIGEASSGSEAIAELKNAVADPYRLVLMDWNMPGKDGMNGLDSAKRIKEEPGIAPDPKIIMVSAYGREDLMRKSEALDLAGYLIKPVRESTLFDAIMLAFGKEMTSGAHSLGFEPELTGKLDGARILLVEDNEINQQVARELMEDAGILVSIANHGQEALQQLRQDHFDGILMDMQMPVMDGITATKEIRNQTRFKSLPIIAMTANAMKADRDLCLAVGMNDHIAKPIDIKALFQILERWILIEGSRYRDSERSSGPVNNLSGDAGIDHNLPDLPGIDLHRGLERLGNNVKLYRQILLRFRSSQIDCLDRIKKAVANNDLDQVAHLAHTLKGVAANIGADRVRKSAADLESAVKLGHDDLSAELETLGFDLPVLLEGLTRLDCSDPESTDGLSTDSSQTRKELDRLRMLLEEDDFEAAKCLAEIRRQLGNNGLEEKLEPLDASINNFEFEAALQQLQDFESYFESDRGNPT